MSRIVGVVFDTRVTAWAAKVTAGIRVFTGLFFVVFALPKFLLHELELAEFVRYGFPDSSLIVYLVGLLELTAGVMLVLGAATRLAAAGLAVVMAGAILTAGVRVGGPFHLGVAPTMLAVTLYLLWAGSGSVALDQSLRRRVRTGV
jgi:putative oxidoreductase